MGQGKSEGNYLSPGPHQHRQEIIKGTILQTLQSVNLKHQDLRRAGKNREHRERMMGTVTEDNQETGLVYLNCLLVQCSLATAKILLELKSGDSSVVKETNVRNLSGQARQIGKIDYFFLCRTVWSRTESCLLKILPPDLPGQVSSQNLSNCDDYRAVPLLSLLSPSDRL